MSYHINKDGKPSVCRATKRPCPYGGSDGKENHFDTKEEAQKFADEKNEKEFGLIASNEAKPKPITNRKQFIEAVNEGPVQVDEYTSYKVVKLNDEEVSMSDSLREQLKSEGLYDNSYVGVFVNEKSQNEPATMSNLPVYGKSSSFETKHFKHSKDEAVKADLKERRLGLLKRAVAFHEGANE